MYTPAAKGNQITTENHANRRPESPDQYEKGSWALHPTCGRARVSTHDHPTLESDCHNRGLREGYSTRTFEGGSGQATVKHEWPDLAS